MAKIPCEEVVFHPSSFADPSGRLFWWNGQLYRAVARERAPLYRELFSKGIEQGLIQKELIVETELTSLELDSYEMVMKHRSIPFVSYPYEWCMPMLRDGALLILDLELELSRHGFTLQDAHPWNILFDGPTPFYVDFGSIVETKPDSFWPAYDQFCRFFLHPLLVMARGHGRMARWLLHDIGYGVLDSELKALTGRGAKSLSMIGLATLIRSIGKQVVPKALKQRLREQIYKVKSRVPPSAIFPQQYRLAALRRLRRQIAEIPIPRRQSEWSIYYDNSFPSFSQSNEWTVKHQNVFKTLERLQPKTVLDIASNQGWYSQLASRQGMKVVAIDRDEACMESLYRVAKGNGHYILPLLMDFRNPAPGYGICNEWFSPATERLRCDMVLALALVHHLVFKQTLNFDQIVRGLSIFSKRWLLVEFVPAEDRYVRTWWSDRFHWYNANNFRRALEVHFSNVSFFPSYPEPRQLILCEK